MEIDEKVARLKLERRKAKETVRLEAAQQLGEEKDERTLEDVIAQMQEGVVNVKGQNMSFEKDTYINGKLQVYLPKGYLKQQTNNISGAIFVNDLAGISFTLSYMQTPGKKQSFEQFKQGMTQNFKQQMGLFMEWLEEGQVKQGESTIYYGMYKVPTGKGNTYNMIFYVQKAKAMILGNYNCFEKDIEDWALIMKATLHLMTINM